jgi:hypothetical protein
MKLPKKLKIEGYEKAIKAYILNVKRFKEIISIYQIGGISSPGISDIDLVIVTKEKFDKKFLKISKETINKYKEYFVHRPIMVNQETWKEINTIIPIFNVKHLYGTTLPISKITNKEKFLHLEQTLNTSAYVPYIQYAFLRETKNSKELNPWKRIIVNFTKDIRYILCRMSSISYEYQLFKDITGGKIKELETVIKEIKTLKEEWFTTEDNLTKLFILLNRVLILKSELIERFTEYTIKNKIVEIRGTQKITLKNFPRTNIYIKDWKPALALNKMRKYIQKKKVVSILPISLFVPLIYEKNTKNIIDKSTKEKIKNKEIIYSHKYKNLILKRLESIDKHQDYLKKNNALEYSFLKLTNPGKYPYLKKILNYFN